MKTLSTFFIATFIVVLLCSAQSTHAKATKRVFFEQYTDAGCGNCVDGAIIMDSILDAYPDRVIGSKMHGTDSMAILGSNDFFMFIYTHAMPAATVDLRSFNYPAGNIIGLDRAYWRRAVDSALTIPALADLSAYYCEGSNGDFVINISAKFDSIPQENLAFKYYILEDDVTGSGQGYDQLNYYNDKVGHPCYGKGNPIVGYKHQMVVRKVGGGLYGINGSIPPSTELNTTQSYDYSETVKINPNWKKDKLKIIALVQFQGQNDAHIDNAVYADKKLWYRENSKQNDIISLYPNPAREKITVHTNLLNGSLVRLDLLNSIGEKISGFEREIRESGGEITLDVSQLAPGTYYLLLETGKKRTIKSFIVTG